MDLEAIEQVLPPWTEVMAQPTEQSVDVHVWGRTYCFANAPLPTSITTAGEEVLASPIRLVGRVDGKPIAWERKGALLLRHDKTQATVSGWQASKTLLVNTTSQVEFDGMMRVDVAVMLQSERVLRGASPKLEELWVEVPLKAERSTLFHYWPAGRWGSAENSGAVPEAGLVLPFKPFIWFGWEEGGLSWFAESSQGWQPNETNRYIEVVQQGEERILRLHILDAQPSRLPLTLTFGFQATPVKPIPKAFHEWRICHGADYGIERQPVMQGKSETVLDRVAEAGVKTLVFHEHWTPIQNYWETTRHAELKHLISECHKRGIKLLLYFGYGFSSLAPEWSGFADEVLVKDPQGRFVGEYYRQPEQREYIVCHNSRWQDRYVEGIAQALEHYGFDGVYLDGTTEPWGCANEQHGCGYPTPEGARRTSTAESAEISSGYRALEGERRVTYPIFAVRRLVKKLYALIHLKGGLVNAHQSTCCVTPILAFCHSYWDGEQFGHRLAGDPLQGLPLSAFRAEFMGKNFGVPCEFLVYEKPPEWTFEDALSFSLLHDVRVRPWGFERSLDLMSKIWKIMTDFGVSEAEWYPYWRNQQFVKSQPESVKVSFYLKGSQALLVISNLSAKQEVEGQVMITPTALGPSGMFTSARDSVTGEHLILEDDRLSLTLPPMRARLVWIE